MDCVKGVPTKVKAFAHDSLRLIVKAEEINLRSLRKIRQVGQDGQIFLANYSNNFQLEDVKLLPIEETGG